MFRKTVIILLILLFAISLISFMGCGGEKEETTTTTQTATQTATQQSATQTQPPNPLPTTTIMVPISVIAGQPTFTLTMNGTGFVNGLSVVKWNGADRPTIYASDTQLTASIPASDIANAGTASVTVFNPTPGGGDSNAQTFTINPVPPPPPPPPASVESMVVVTRTGEKYHTSGCQYVRGKTNTRTIPLSQAKAEGYTPCKVCDPPQ